MFIDQIFTLARRIHALLLIAGGETASGGLRRPLARVHPITWNVYGVTVGVASLQSPQLLGLVTVVLMLMAAATMLSARPVPRSIRLLVSGSRSAGLRQQRLDSPQQGWDPERLAEGGTDRGATVPGIVPLTDQVEDRNVGPGASQT